MAKQKLGAIPVPEDLESVIRFFSRLSEVEVIIEAIKGDLKDKIRQLTDEAMDKVLPLESEAESIVDGLFVFAEVNRNKLTEGEKRKTVDTPHGVFGWRLTPPKVTIKGVKRVIELIKKLKLLQFLHTKESVDKKAMLKEPEKAQSIQGVGISQEEEFFVKLTELKLELTRTIKSRKGTKK